MRSKIIVLYGMLIIFIGLSIFALWQFVLPFCQSTDNTEEPYAFTELQELVEVSEEDFKVEYDGNALYSQNDDFIGWLAIPDTTISFPIVLGNDNSFYLNHGFNKAYSYYGCPFLDTRTPVGGDNMVIHGHNMGNNRTEIFSPLLLFQDPSYAAEHKSAYFSFYPSNIQTQYELFAVVNFNANNEANYLFSQFESEEHRNEYISSLKEKSLYDSEVIPSGDILVLSTCNRRYGGDNRLLICYSAIE